MKRDEKISWRKLRQEREIPSASPEEAILAYGKDILLSKGMDLEKTLIQHAESSVYEHSLRVAYLSVKLARKYHLKVNVPSMVRAALLHDYFLYDWHIKPHPKHHAHLHAQYAYENAKRDFMINPMEKNIILSHMWPLRFFLFPKCREAWLVNLADDIATCEEMSRKSYEFERKLPFLQAKLAH